MTTISTFIILCLALLVDHFLGEPKQFHPLVGFGNYANKLEKYLNSPAFSNQKLFALGFIALFLAVFPIIFIVHFFTIQNDSIWVNIFTLVIVYSCIGMQSLRSHAIEIYQSLQSQSLENPSLENQSLSISRSKVAMIVSRDTDQMQASDISRATIESVLENGSDAVFAPVFWFIIAGVPGILAYRLINTLDAMWGYKTKQFKYFGFAVAKLDDLINYIPARLTALSYAMMGNWQSAIYCWKTQAKHWSGVNPGVVMSAGSGALGIKLGGGDFYHGEFINRPDLGEGKIAQADDIINSVELLKRVLWLWLFLLFLIFFSGFYALY
ncbi:MAG: adenosylcobinamide-phosphate synthase CbiB [Pseudomonadota bacterium]